MKKKRIFLIPRRANENIVSIILEKRYGNARQETMKDELTHGNIFLIAIVKSWIKCPALIRSFRTVEFNPFDTFSYENWYTLILHRHGLKYSKSIGVLRARRLLSRSTYSGQPGNFSNKFLESFRTKYVVYTVDPLLFVTEFRQK